MSAPHRPADGRARFGREAEVGQELRPCGVLVYPETRAFRMLTYSFVCARNRTPAFMRCDNKRKRLA